MTEISVTKIIELVNALKDKISKYETDFSRNEALVRYSIINPFLIALGWDISNPAQVIPEYSTNAGRADYALLKENRKRPIAFLGAKKLGTKEDLGQHLNYCLQEGVKYFIATDGQKWELYDTHKDVPLFEKKSVEWDILNDDTSQIAIKSLVIANIGSFGEEPFQPIHKVETDATNENKQEQSSIVRNRGTLNERRVGNRRSPLRPLSLTIEEKTFQVNKSNQILIKTAEWLISEGKLDVSAVPIESGPDRWLISTKKIHRNGSPFKNPSRLSNGLFIETNYGSRRIEELARRLMKHFGYSENSISVNWMEMKE
ncbi:MAG: hypothetical protein M1290_06405 [Candidatus Thermoplasmatota archaeon]|jgi:hypothetical protein|nr:hypothetical protein [Candidatus Thermoplasmatota archaeon]MCL5790075.1 hypothetical protein [Candidatus Thermoplasmatota archaeon]